MFRIINHTTITRISSAFLALALFLSACNVPTPALPQAGTVETPVLPPANSAATSVPTQAVQNPPAASGAVNFDLNGLDQNVTSEEVAAVSATPDGPWWQGIPQHRLLTLQGYPITSSLWKPQIFVYETSDLAASEASGQILAGMQTLLQTQQAGRYIPFMPVNVVASASQMLHAQVKFLDFKNGKGVRYLTQYANGFVPVNNNELIYTYQGLTSDGKYYIAAVMPVNMAGLPANDKVTGQEPPEFTADFSQYLSNTTSMLDQQPISAATPDLSKLDAVMQSIEIK